MACIPIKVSIAGKPGILCGGIRDVPVATLGSFRLCHCRNAPPGVSREDWVGTHWNGGGWGVGTQGGWGDIRDVLEERKGGVGRDPPPPMVPPTPAPKAPENFFKGKSSCAKGTEEKFCLKRWKGRRGSEKGWGGGGSRGGGAPPIIVSRSNTSLGYLLFALMCA